MAPLNREEIGEAAPIIFGSSTAMNPDLSQALQRVLAHHAYLRMAVLFGSLAHDHAHADSDIDLAVSAGRVLSTEQKMALITDLAEVTGRPIDLIDLDTVGEPLLGQILKHGRRILGGDHHYAELLKRHLFEEADFMPYQRRILAERRWSWIGN